MGEFPSGQRGQTVNLLAVPSVVRIHLPPPEHEALAISTVAGVSLNVGSGVLLVILPTSNKTSNRIIQSRVACSEHRQVSVSCQIDGGHKLRLCCNGRVQAIAVRASYQRHCPAIGETAKMLQGIGFKAYDSLHVACAIFAGCDCILTVDNRMLKKQCEEIEITDPVIFINKWLKEGRTT